jgi:drug/metabolite transporter (DMT)-like permease
VYWSEQWIPSGLAAVLFATYPLFVALLAHLMLPGESMSLVELAGVVAGFGGVGVIFSEDLAALGGPGVALAAAVMLVSPVVSAIASVAIKRWGEEIHPFSISGVPMLIASGAMGLLSLAVERDRDLVWTRSNVSALLYLALFGSAITFTMYYWLLARIAAKRAALISYLIPVVAVARGTARGEAFTGRMLAGSALVVAGVAVAVQGASWTKRTTAAATANEP